MLSPFQSFPVEFEALAQKAPVSIMFIDSSGVVSFVNDWHLEHFARGLHERSYFLGKSFFSLPGIVSSGVGDAIKPVLTGQDVLLERVFTAEFSGGQSGYQTIRAVGVRSGSNTGGAVIIREDVTRWVEMERHAREERVRLRALLNATQDSAVLMDANGRLLALNDEAARRRGKSVDELLGKSIYRNMDPEAAQFRRAMAEKVLLCGKPVEYEEQTGERTYWVSIYPLPDAAGRTEYLGSFSRDITERKHLERALIQAKQRAEASFVAKTQFLANISHELRTPLNGILGAAQLAADDSLPEEQRELWSIVSESGERLLRSINSLLDLADITSHALQPAMRPFSPKKTVLSVVDNFELQARLKGISLKAGISPDVPDVLTGDEFRLRQILTNLLSNALQCTQEGEVRVKVDVLHKASQDSRAAGPITCIGGIRLVFSVEDTGIGIAPEKLPCIFESFSLTEDALTKTHSGAGVGLAIARSLVELLGGKIWAESTPGAGSTFSFTACFWPDADTAEGEPGHAANIAEANGIRVLIVEDEHINMATASLMLTRQGYAVTGAQDGREGLRALKNGSFDVVLMDIQMPVMDGITATRMIRGGELPGVDRRIPIIALTAYTTQKDRTRFLKEGMDGFIPKPFNADDLTEAIGKALIARATL
ncbi:MAG: response regulator [Desulfovibrio sp.]|nr:response regulator [Desulfovibrio sp.]MBI4960371.1 response regulator [Desulfovibrio sp.]